MCNRVQTPVKFTCSPARVERGSVEICALRCLKIAAPSYPRRQSQLGGNGKTLRSDPTVIHRFFNLAEDNLLMERLFAGLVPALNCEFCLTYLRQFQESGS